MELVSAGTLGGVIGKGADKRAGGLQKIYENKLKALDRRYHGTREKEKGPLERRLDSFGKLEGLVVGAWGEGSKDLHALVKTMAEARVLASSQARGFVAGEGELSIATANIRRVLSCVFVRAQALCLLARLSQVGAGARGAADRRAAAIKADFTRRQEARANWFANVRGRGLSRVGIIYIP